MKKLACLLAAAAFFISLGPGSPRQALAQAGAWIVHWDMRGGLNEAVQFKGLSQLILFAASFDSRDQVFLPTELDDYLNDEYQASSLPPDRKVYLSVVNDSFDDHGGAILKDSGLIHRLMASPESRGRHKADLLALLERGRFAGLELDYEKVSPQDWPTLLAFAADLAADLAARGQKLRFLLEPKEQYLKSDLPAGPEYSLMAYNLYGSHSGPGPKADPAFLEKLASWCSRLPEKPRLALSTGGFAWEQEEVVSLTEIAARAKAAILETEPERDEDSGYLKFRVKDGTVEARSLVEFVRGVYVDVWYADGRTLAGLAAQARALGFTGIDIWRIGGNRPDSLEMVLEAAK